MKTVIQTEPNRQRILAAVSSLPLGGLWEVEIRPFKPKRTLPQNSRFHVIVEHVATTYAERTGKYYTKEAWKIFFKDLFLGYEEKEVAGRIIRTLKHTSDASKEEMQKFTEKVEHYCGAELQIWLPSNREEE